MGFLSGTIAFERFRIDGPVVKRFQASHIEALERFAISQLTELTSEEAQAGFLAGGHLFDQEFSLEKNVIGDCLLCEVRIDTNKIPSALRKAWLAIELLPLIEANPSGRLTKAQRQEAKEAVEARCADEAASGKFKRQQSIPLLWHGREQTLFVGSSSPVAIELANDLFQRAFDVTLLRLSAGRVAYEWAEEEKKLDALEAIEPSVFHANEPGAHSEWLNGNSASFDFLGNEFLLWLWWTLETQSDTLTVADDAELIVMLNRTLPLECPRGDSGKETITSEAPVRLPEAHHAIKSGKLPRKSGLLIVRDGIQYDLVLQAELFSVSGGKIKLVDETREKEEATGSPHEERLESFKGLVETLDALYIHFCARRLSKAWNDDLKQMRRWLSREAAKSKNPAA